MKREGAQSPYSPWRRNGVGCWKEIRQKSKVVLASRAGQARKRSSGTCGRYTMRSLYGADHKHPHNVIRYKKDSPQTVMTTPMMFSSVSWSPKTQAEMEMVVTSLKIPAIDIGTDPARCMMLKTGQLDSSIFTGHDPQILARDHGKSQSSRKDNHPDRQKPFRPLKMLTPENRQPPFQWYTHHCQRHRHEWSQPEDRRKRVTQPHRLLMHHQLGQRPSQSGQTGG